MPESTVTTSEPTTAATPTNAGAPGVDVVKLAEKVYRLMLADARLSLARGQRPKPGAVRAGARAE